MRTLELTIDGNAVARIAGADFAPRPSTRTRWAKFSSIEIRVPDAAQETWLRFDAEATTTHEAPSNMGMDKADARQSNLFFERETTSTDADQWEVPLAKSSIILRFHWSNPLTPGSRGLWIRLHLVRVGDGLRITGEGGNETRIWSFDGKSQDWKSRPLLPILTRTWTPAELAANLFGQKYVDGDGAGCRFLTRSHSAWVVDASGVEKIDEQFRLHFLEGRPIGGIRPLGARFIAHASIYDVNADALAVERHAALSLHAPAIDLTCARRGTAFLLEWRIGDGANRDHEQLSLNTLYNALARHYVLGMAAARSRNRLSFAPTKLRAETARVLFDARDTTTRLRQVLVDEGVRVLWLTGAASEIGAKPVELAFRQEAPAPALREIAAGNDEPRALLLVAGPGIDGVTGGWLANGVRLEPKAFAHASLELRQTPGVERYGQAPVALDLRLQFAEAALRPVSDDPEIGFETLSTWLDRERPIVIDLETTKPPRLKLEIRELANETQSRVLRIGVRNAETNRVDYNVDAVVLDPSPLTSARVQSVTPVDPDGLVAEYTDDSDQAPEWAFASTEGEMNVVLPPQVIGEEMIKGRLYLREGEKREEVPSTDTPFDFRLSPAARLTLDRTDIDTARTVAPWSLRRLLGQRPGVVGARLQRAELELLYGLLTTIEDVPGLRIGELDGLVGRIPFADELLDYLRAARQLRDDADAADELRGAYAARIARLIRGLLYRPSWWPLFRDFTARQQLTVAGKGVSSALRPTRATAHPFEIGLHAADPPGDDRTPLRGGVDWPFQSRAVYDELTSSPESSSVALEGLAFGTLGGSGKQTAEFNDGKTIIISETTQGRLDSVTVIRIGRIAMLWNHARHVIVYERTTRRAPRYAIEENEPDEGIDTWEFQSKEFEGFAALRKVREYVEITEQKRSYPDTATTRPIAGPLKASFFETTIIPVKSSWGRDVPSGFVIALRGPLVEAEKRFFPFPKIFLKQARARAKGEGTVDHQLKDPSELLFYTSTRPEDGGDPDQWAPVPDIDFPLIRRPAEVKPLEFRSRFSRFRRQPDARIAEFGQKRFTITLDPPEEAVDLMHGRLSEGIEARVSSVSLARGGLSDAAMPAGSLAAAATKTMTAAHARLHDGLAELRMQIAQARAGGAKTLADLGAFTAEAKQLIDELRADSKLIEKMLPPAVSSFNWAAEQTKWNERFKANGERQLESWRRQLDLARFAPSQLVDDARAALQHVCQQVHQRIDEAGSLPLEAMERIDIAHAALDKRAQTLVDGVTGALHAAIDRLQARYNEIVQTAAEPELSAPGLHALQEEVDAALDAFLASLARFDIDALKHVTDTLGDWFHGGGTGLLAELEATLRELCADLRLLAEDLVASVPPVEILEPDWQGMKDASTALLDGFKKTVIDLASQPVKALRKELMPFLDEKTGRLAKVQTVHDNVETACREASELLDTDAAQALDTFLKAVKPQLDSVGGELLQVLNDLPGPWKTAAGSFDHLKTLRDNADAWFTELADGLDIKLPLDDVEQKIEEAARKIADALEGTALQVERAIVEEIHALGLAVGNAVSGLDLTRVLATGPINDAIRCTRDQLGYYYDAARDLLDVTRASALFNELGASVLNALSVELPFDRIRDRLLPQLQGLNLGELLPNFGGLRLEHLFPDLAVPNDGQDNEWIRVRHGFDKDRLTAFADVSVDKVLEGSPAVFVLPPLALRIAAPHFLASSRLELSQAGGKSQSTKASLHGDWMLCLSDKPIVTISDATLRYDSDGGFDFDFDSENVVLANELQFITDAMKKLLPQEEGLTLTPIMPAGIRAELALPLPDLGTGAFTLTGITLYTVVELSILDGFEVRAGFWLSKPERPFGLAVLFLGGGGWVGVEARYRPPDRFVTRVSVGIAAGAFVAVNFGVARGSAGLLFTVGLDFFRDWQSQSGRTLVTLGILVWGEFSILGIASASLRLSLAVTYDGSTGTMIGRGRVEVSIKICWCFTLRVSQQVQQRFAGKGGGSGTQALSAADASARDTFRKAIRTVNTNVAL